MFSVTREITFCYGHRLMGHGGKCRHLHGHTGRAVITLASDLGFSTAFAQQGAERLTFGNLEPLVTLMQETTAARLLPLVVERLRGGASLRDVVAAAALANARTFGGEDYIGFHTLMALAPAYHMACQLPEAQRALPVLKVLYRNTNHIQQMGGLDHETLRPIDAPASPGDRANPGDQLHA